MPPTDLEQRINQMDLVLRTHQHSGVDFTQALRGQDLQQIGRTILSASATSISVTIPQKRFLKVIISWGEKSGVSNDFLTFNSDTGNNYTTTTGVSQANIDIRNGANSALGGFSIIEVANNLSTIVKPVFVHTVNRITSAGTAISSYEIFACWVNTTAPITTITLTSSDADTYPQNTELLVLSTKE